MRIVHLLASPVWSGPMELVALLALAQRALGHEASVAIDRRRGGGASEEPALPRLEALGLVDDRGLELSVKSPPWQVVADTRRLFRREADVVHAHFTHDHLVARLGLPAGAILVRSIHAPRSLRRWRTPRADAWTVPYPGLLRRVKSDRAMVLPPLVDPAFVPPIDRAALRRELGLTGSSLVGMISTFQKSRRHDLGLRAFARLLEHKPDAHLVLAGDGALESELRALVRSLGLDGRVTFTGYLAQEAFIRQLQALDVVWLLGLGNDFSGRAAAQARACGARVVAVDEGGLAALADAIVEPRVEAIVEATGAGDRREVAMRTNEKIAREVLELYLRARG